MSTRRAMIHSTQGLTQIDTYDPAYIPDPWLQSWLARERPFFLTGEDHRLIPRGLLLKGEPGTGKTACAKYIAAQLGVPCYRIDLGETKNKWVGQSEANLKAALQRLDQEAPCVALLDEIEKMTGGHESDSTGVTSSMMSQLLWWQAERRARVLPVMTTNDITKLPPELYRPGRIDKVVEFSGLKTPASIIKFAQHVLKQFPVELHVPPKILTEGLAHLVAPQTQATITEAVKEIIKTHAKH
jgi:SpoVK/Ycf46/Vps4 family AAA+-type ATPase